mmetsp:Transcript_96260/g.151626  ORF Transcript_96260/g.151626 Transcript_96260/m.151626 type:complete len:293 (+) Transcript_96260:71-949(+)
MHHGPTVFFFIASVPDIWLVLGGPPKLFATDGPGGTANAFEAGGRDEDANSHNRVGTVAHALGRHGVRKHVQDLQKEAQIEWKQNFLLDYQLMNYKKTIAEMTKTCIEMMETMRDEMSYETATLVDKEVERVWPALEMQGAMKKVVDLDRANGQRGPWFKAADGTEVDQSFPLQEFYPEKVFWRNYLEHQLHPADFKLMANGGKITNSEGKNEDTDPPVKTSFAGHRIGFEDMRRTFVRPDELGRSERPHSMLSGEVRPLHRPHDDAAVLASLDPEMVKAKKGTTGMNPAVT